MRARLLLFTKPARPGRVKTRLIGRLTAEQAALLHQAFQDDLIDRLRPGRFDLALAWALEAGEEVPESDLPSIRQQGDDLGERLFRALDGGGADHHTLVAAVGSDHPELALEDVERGFSLLAAGVDVVLGPAADGGYTFVGVRRQSLRRELFEKIDWSTSAVLEQTLDRCRELGASVVLLDEGTDVDTPEDLEGLIDRLEAHDADAAPNCPHTRAVLESLGLLRTESVG